MSETNRQWILRARPQGHMRIEDFELKNVPAPTGEVGAGEIRIRNVAFLCAPTMRNWMDPPGNSFYPSVPLGEVMLAPAVARVVASGDPTYPVGTRVYTISSWQDYATIPTGAGLPLHALPEGLSFLEGIGRYGLNPLTAYFGLLDVGQPQAGETLVVSGAAGSTGSTAAQIGKIKGLRVIGIAGGAAKCAWLREECGLDAAVDYKAEPVEERLAGLCPDGIDVFYDNVGGEILQAAVNNMAPFGRIVLCGMMTKVNETEPLPGPRNLDHAHRKRLTLKGFNVVDHLHRLPEFHTDMGKWIADGHIKWQETIAEGIENAPQAFIGLFKGENFGKMIVKIGDV